jgi:tetratricopeptide (TPR) repeat protein
MRGAAALIVLSLSLPAGAGAAGAGPDDITAATALAVGGWVSAVRTHTSGRRDAPVATVSALTFDKRRELNAGMGLFLSVLLGKGVVTTTDAQKHIASLAREARQNPGAAMFLKRAAVVHSDAALQNQVDGSASTPMPASALPSPGAPESPLLSRHRLYIDKDGEILGETLADWNWPFARFLLDLVSPRPADDPFVGTWYHATTAFMLQKGLYGEVVTHLARAAAVLPDDARVLFDRGCFAEIQGLPKSQVLLTEGDLIVLRAQRIGQRPPRQMASTATQLGIPPGDVANVEAERLFRLALRVDPSFVEARVRLARLLEERKRYEEAAAELGSAFDGKPDGPVLFYADLFAGRAAQALGRIDEAAAHYRDAAALFPAAQSALLAQSQVALLGADVQATLGPIDRLEYSSPAQDPWWQYDLAAGRDADALLKEMWATVLKF